MNVVSVDFETALIAPRVKAPPATCLAICGSKVDDVNGLWHCVAPNDAESRLTHLLLDPEVTVVGHNFAAFDAAVALAEFPRIAPALFQAFAEGRVRDTKIREQLYDIAYGKLYQGPINPKTDKATKKSYSLENLCIEHLGVQPWKSEWRLRYAELRNVSIDQWPAEAVKYPLEDVDLTLRLHDHQEARGEGIIFKNEPDQVRAAFALHLSSCWGVHVDPDRFQALAKRAAERIAELHPKLQAASLVRGDGSRAVKVARARAEDVTQGNVRLTKKGQTSLAKKAIEGYDDATLREYSELAEWRAVVDKDLKMFAPGLVQTSYGMAATGRSTSSSPNIQNLRRLPGVREVLAARPGKVFLVADLSIGELRTWAQICLWILGFSDMADTIRAGEDPHAKLGADLAGVDYQTLVDAISLGDKDAKRFRQLGKHTNFGFPGGMGIKTFIELCWTFGHVIDKGTAEFFRNAWKSRWREAQPYFDAMSNMGDATATIKQYVSERIYGEVFFTERCNAFFQGLLADLAKDVCWRITQESFVGEGPLRAAGAHLVIFNHDEWVVEIDEDPELATLCAEQLEGIVMECGKRWTPDVPPKVEPLLCRRWSKNAERLIGDNGLLEVWDEPV